MLRRFLLVTLSIMFPTFVSAADQVLSTTIDGIETEIFIPGEHKLLRGVLVHSANYKLKPGDRWEEFCHQHAFAHVATNMTNVRTQGNRQPRLAKALHEGLKEFAAKSNHPELVNLPFAGTGHSAGGLVTGVLLADPSRTITNCVDCGWVMDPKKHGEEAGKVPALFTLGAVPDAFKMLPLIEQYYDPARTAGLPWGLGLQHGCAHDFGNSATLMVAWIAGVAEQRLPKETPADGKMKLIDIKQEAGWLGDRSTVDGNFATIAPYADYKGDKAKATWFPNEAVATVWRAYQSNKSPIMLTAVAGDRKLAEFTVKKSFDLMADPELDITLGVKKDDELMPKKISFYAADKLLGEANAEGKFVWKAPMRGQYQVYAMWEMADGTRGVSNPALVTVRKNKAAVKE